MVINTNLSFLDILIQIAIICSLGFITNYLLVQFTLCGLLGYKLQSFLADKFRRTDFSWFNELLFFFLIIFFILIFNGSIIYLDNGTEVIVNCNDVTIKIKGNYLDLIASNIGSVAAFGVGAKIAFSLVAKHPMSGFNKFGASMVGGASSYASFQLTNSATKVVTGKYSLTTPNENTLLIHIKDVTLNNVQTERFNKDFVLKFLENTLHKLTPDYFGPNANNQKVIEVLTKEKNQEVKEIFTNDNNTAIVDLENTAEIQDFIKNFFIESPSENNASIIDFFNDLNTTLSLNLFVNICMLYFIFMLTLIFTIKFIVSTDVFLGKVKSLPLGRVGTIIHYILSKIILGWQISSIFWIYLILFFLFICSCSSTYAIYACHVAINNLIN